MNHTTAPPILSEVRTRFSTIKQVVKAFEIDERQAIDRFSGLQTRPTFVITDALGTYGIWKIDPAGASSDRIHLLLRGNKREILAWANRNRELMAHPLSTQHSKRIPLA